MSLSNLHAQLINAPPLERWSPPFCGKIDMKIKRDGTWFYQGSPIARPALVKLFSRVIWFENETYYLKTPVELVEIEVEDLPFLIVEMREEAGVLWFRTLQDEWVAAREILSEMRGETLLLHVNIRRNLYARLNRPVYYELIERGILQNGYFGIVSDGHFSPLCREEALC